MYPGSQFVITLGRLCLGQKKQSDEVFLSIERNFRNT